MNSYTGTPSIVIEAPPMTMTDLSRCLGTNYRFNDLFFCFIKIAVSVWSAFIGFVFVDVLASTVVRCIGSRDDASSVVCSTVVRSIAASQSESFGGNECDVERGGEEEKEHGEFKGRYELLSSQRKTIFTFLCRI